MSISIFVVEDNPLERKLIINMLNHHCYEIFDYASSGNSAIEIIKKSDQKPDLILMDIIIEGEMDGLQTANIISNTYDIPIIYMTSIAKDSLLERAKKNSGTYAYIVKPVNHFELKSVIEFTLYRHNIEKQLKNEITERKIAEEKLETALKDTKEIMSILKIRNDELLQFSYAASHDLLEPIRSIIIFSELLEDNYKNKLDKTAGEFLQFILNNAKRMHLLIKDLLEYSKLSSQDLNKQWINVLEICNIVKENIFNIINKKNAVIKYNNLDNIEIYANKTQIIQLLQNLIINGIKYCDKDIPCIEISLEETSKEWLFAIKDNGIGIEKQYFKKIFIIFQRLQQKDIYDGTGVGLAICKAIVDKHGGKIWIESKIGQGSTFYFSILKGKKCDI